MSKLLVITLLFLSLPCFALQKFTVLLDWQLNPVHAPMVIAKHLHYYADAGLDCQFITPSNPSDQPKMVASKKVDVALYSPDKTLKAIEGGLPIRHCGTLIKSPLASIAVLDHSPIEKIEDLKGKKIGRTGSQKSLTLATMLKSHGIDIKDVKLLQLQYGLAPALATKSVDAVMIFRNVEPPQLKQMGLQTRLFHCEDHGMPDHEALIFICQKDPSPHLKTFIDATNKAVTFIHKNPEQSWEHFKSYNRSTSKLIHKDIWNCTFNLFPTNIKTYDTHKLINYIHFLKENMILKRLISLSEYTIY